MNKRAWVFAGGEFSPYQLKEYTPVDGDAVVCVDRGLSHCLTLGWKPTLLVGDLDSVAPSTLEAVSDIPIEQYPVRKNCSDLELALALIFKERYADVIVVGISGGRTDHLLFNWFLPLSLPQSRSLRFIDASVDARLVSPQLPLSELADVGATASLFPLTVATGVTTSGFEYPLEDAVLNPGISLGLSNRVSESAYSVRVKSGLLWFMQVVSQ